MHLADAVSPEEGNIPQGHHPLAKSQVQGLLLHREGVAFKNMHQAPCGLAAALLLAMLKVRNWGFSAGASWGTVYRNSRHVFLIFFCSPEPKEHGG